jgi:hypothetical protein
VISFHLLSFTAGGCLEFESYALHANYIQANQADEGHANWNSLRGEGKLYRIICESAINTVP